MSSFWSALVVVFVAELGDKTQLVALGFGARSRLGWVLAGIGIAYLATNLLSVPVGAVLGAALPDRVLYAVGGVLFIGFAVWTLGDTGADDEPPGSASGAVGNGRAPLRVVGPEPGARLGRRATVGIFLAGALGATVGRAIGDRLPRRWVRLGAAGLFAAFGVALVASAIR